MPKPIRVLQVLAQMNRGGAETMVMNLYRNIDRNKVQFDFITHTENRCDFDSEIESLGGYIYHVPKYTGINHFKYKKAWHDFFKQHPEYKIIHGHVRSTASIYLNIAKKFGLVTIAHSHSIASRGNGVEQFVKNIAQYSIRYKADYFFACSDEAGKWLFGKKAVKSNRYRLIKNAINTREFIFSESKRNEVRKYLNIEDKFVIGHVGSFTYPKNHNFLIQIFNEVQKRNKFAVLLLVGEGELRSEIEKQISDIGLKDKIIFVGKVSDVSAYLQAMDVFVFPSLFEGLGMAVIEAQAAGLPCVVSDNVPKEAYVTDLINVISLKRSAEFWASEVLNCCNGNTRANMSDIIKKAGYDICDSAKKLEIFYLQHQNDR